MYFFIFASCEPVIHSSVQMYKNNNKWCKLIFVMHDKCLTSNADYNQMGNIVPFFSFLFFFFFTQITEPNAPLLLITLYSWACAGFVTAGCWRKIVSVQVERSERSERSVLTAWGPGARSRALVGSRGNAPAGVQGAEPPEAPGFSGFFRPQNASPRIVFLLFWRQVFLQNHLIYYDIRWYNDEGSFIIFRYRLLYYHTEAWFWFWHWRAQGECLRVMCPPWKAWFFF